MIGIIMKTTNGNILETFSQLEGSDEVWYKPGDNKYYLALSSWTSSGKTGGIRPVLSPWLFLVAAQFEILYFFRKLAAKDCDEQVISI
jgi:hypothetical protein